MEKRRMTIGNHAVLPEMEKEAVIFMRAALTGATK